MNLKYFNPETSNPSDYFWFNSFTPDLIVERNKNPKLNSTGKSTEKGSFYFEGTPCPVASKILTAEVIYVIKNKMQEILSHFVPNNNSDIFSLQINSDCGRKIIVLPVENDEFMCCQVQNHYSVINYLANIDRYVDIKDFFRKCVLPINKALINFYVEQ